MAFEGHVDLGIEVSLALEIVDQIPLPFFDQIAINRSLGINRHQLLNFPPGQKWYDAQTRSRDPDRHQRTDLDVKGDVDAIAVGVVLRWIFPHHASQPLFAGER